MLLHLKVASVTIGVILAILLVAKLLGIDGDLAAGWFGCMACDRAWRRLAA